MAKNNKSTRRYFSVEHRRIGQRDVQLAAQPETRKLTPAIIVGPIAREISYSLRTSPLRFPKHWIKD